MDHSRFDTLARHLAEVRLSRADALRVVAAGALAILAGAALAGEETAAWKQGKKQRVCLCPTADATSCTGTNANKKQARKLATQACNYRGRCQPGVVGSQCSPSCPPGQIRCGAACVDPQRDAANCGACGTACKSWQTCAAGVCAPACGGEGPPCRVFLTSTTHTGNLGGLAGADAICQQLADAAGLPGTYKAWLSDSTGSPSTRFRSPTGPYALVDDTVVAASWADLTDGALANAINLTEAGDPSGSAWAWTNTLADGTAGGPRPEAHCQNWTSATNDQYGNEGSATQTNAKWTANSYVSCVEPDHLYCFQQS